MSRKTNDELPDDLLDKLKLLHEQPDDYDADTRPLVPLNEEDIGTFRPPRYCSESVSLKNLLAGQIFIASKHLVLEERITTC